MDAAAMEEFLDIGMQFRREGGDGTGSMWIVPENHGLHSVVEVIVDRDSPQGPGRWPGARCITWPSTPGTKRTSMR